MKLGKFDVKNHRYQQPNKLKFCFYVILPATTKAEKEVLRGKSVAMRRFFAPSLSHNRTQMTTTSGSLDQSDLTTFLQRVN